jgi:hypothetical protein
MSTIQDSSNSTMVYVGFHLSMRTFSSIGPLPRPCIVFISSSSAANLPLLGLPMPNQLGLGDSSTPAEASPWCGSLCCKIRTRGNKRTIQKLDHHSAMIGFFRVDMRRFRSHGFPLHPELPFRTIHFQSKLEHERNKVRVWCGNLAQAQSSRTPAGDDKIPTSPNAVRLRRLNSPVSPTHNPMHCLRDDAGHSPSCLGSGTCRSLRSGSAPRDFGDEDETPRHWPSVLGSDHRCQPSRSSCQSIDLHLHTLSKVVIY